MSDTNTARTANDKSTGANAGLIESVFLWLEGRRDVAMVSGIIGIMALMIVPLPPLMLDLLLTVNITLAVLIILTSMYVQRPLDFSVFPALLLITTLFRLGLNVASTRLILMGAADGNAQVGKIIETFGRYVVGGNSIIGIIIFLILVVINFMVITKGAGRIAEVTARFTLDALPGKQMSIDSEVASGAISDSEAKKKRRELEAESEFYGAMDGASKFVRGDAIAGLIITAINIFAGLLIAVTQGGLPFGDAVSTYTILTVGDGLVSQIPALLISTGSGIIVTRAAGDSDLGKAMGGQMLGNRKVLYGAAAVLLLMGIMPGMPFFVFSGLATVVGMLAYRMSNAAEGTDDEDTATVEEKDENDNEPKVEDLLRVDTLTLEIGYGLVSLVDDRKGSGTLLDRLVQMRRQFADELGIIVPPIHIRDNLALDSAAYRLLLKQTPIGEGRLAAGRMLAIDPGTVATPIKGMQTKDPTFGLDALWIDPKERFRAEGAGYTVVDLDGVITTHVSELVRQNAADLLGWQELQERLDLVKEQAPKLIEELIPTLVSFGTVLKVLRRLLSERISIRDLRTILEAIAESADVAKTVTALTNQVRERLAPQISAAFIDEDGTIHAALLDRHLEDRLRQCIVTQNNEPTLACDLATAQGLFKELEDAMAAFAVHDAEPIILAPPDLRSPLQQFLVQFFPNVHVICHREVASRAQIVSVSQLRLRGELNAQALTDAA